jgi:hypothetical protein
MARRRGVQLLLAAVAVGAFLRAVPMARTAPDFPLLFAADFESGRADGWMPNAPDRWRVGREDGSLVYQLVTPGEPGPVRAPASRALIKDYDVGDFVLTGRLKCHADTANDKRDICVIFHYRDPTHFGYVHFSASSDGFHNIIGLVNGADRVKINREPAGASVFRLTDRRFRDFKVTGDAATGEIRAFLDDMANPILMAVERTLAHGLVGVGSYDDTGSFDDLKLWGNALPKNEESIDE